MKTPMLLKQFKYSIPSSSIAVAGIKNHFVAEHLPLMEMAIDFENGNLKLEGDWHFMTVANEYNETGWTDHYKGRVQIETAIYASLAINLHDPENDNLVFPLEGTIKHGNSIGSCSGLLVLDNIPVFNGLMSDHWNIIFYLYDLQFIECEMKFNLPFFMTGGNDGDN